MKYNLSEIMHKAWKLYRKGTAAFAECLHRAWNSAKAQPINAQRISEAQTAAGVTEEVNTWAGWRAAGCEVLHGAKAFSKWFSSIPARATARPTARHSLERPK